MVRGSHNLHKHSNIFCSQRNCVGIMMGCILCCCVNFDMDAFHASNNIVLSSNVLIDAHTKYNNFNHLEAEVFTAIASVHLTLKYPLIILYLQ